MLRRLTFVIATTMAIPTTITLPMTTIMFARDLIIHERGITSYVY